jgi:sec-independent protein translocase protein TatB
VFNVGPLELLVLAIVGLIVIGPDKLPGLARDAARMLRTLRDLAQGARTQLRDELGPEFADVDLRNLNPRTAVSRAVFGEDGVAGDLRSLHPKNYLQDAFSDDDDGADADDVQETDDSDGVSLHKPVSSPPQRPLGRDERAPFDTDAT